MKHCYSHEPQWKQLLLTKKTEIYIAHTAFIAVPYIFFRVMPIGTFPISPCCDLSYSRKRKIHPIL